MWRCCQIQAGGPDCIDEAGLALAGQLIRTSLHTAGRVKGRARQHPEKVLMSRCLLFLFDSFATPHRADDVLFRSGHLIAAIPLIPKFLDS